MAASLGELCVAAGLDWVLLRSRRLLGMDLEQALLHKQQTLEGRGAAPPQETGRGPLSGGRGWRGGAAEARGRCLR